MQSQQMQFCKKQCEDVFEVAEIIGRPQMEFAEYKRRISSLDADAERVQSMIEFQLDLKARYASAREAHIATLLGVAVTGFTVVTIVFTPLAFMASLFALPISDWQTGDKLNYSNYTNGAPLFQRKTISDGMGMYKSLQVAKNREAECDNSKQ